MASSGQNLFLAMFILVVALSSSSSTIEAREGRLFFSKYFHSSTTQQTPISEISSTPSSSPATSPAPSPVSADESQIIAAVAVGDGLWGAGSDLVVPKEDKNAPAATDTVYPTYKNDAELEAALNGDDGSVYSAVGKENRVAGASEYRGQSRSNSGNEMDGFNRGKRGSNNFDDSVNLAATNGFKNVDGDDGSVYSATSEENRVSGGDNEYRGQSSSSYGNELDVFDGGRSGTNNFDESVNLDAAKYRFHKVDYSKQYKFNNNDDDNHAYSASTKPQYQYQSYNGGNEEEKEQEFSGNGFSNQYNNRDEGVSFSASSNNGDEGSYNGNSNGYGEVERQGMSDTRFMAGGKYYHDVNQEWP